MPGKMCIYMTRSLYPNRSWAVILQQAWSMCLKDRIHHQNHDPGRNGKKKEICRHFNKGLCTAGVACKYKHWCSVPDCKKFGHGVHICHKRNAAGQSGNNKPNTISEN